MTQSAELARAPAHSPSKTSGRAPLPPAPAPIPFNRNTDVIPLERVQLSPLIQRVTADNPGPFTFTGTGVFIVGAGDDICVIDPGPITPGHEAALDAAIGDRRVSHILVTHHHADHTPMARPLAAKHGCLIYGQGAPVRDDGEAEVRLEAGADAGFSPDVEICDGHVFEGSDWTLTALHTPGHTSNHMCYALAEENTLFSGDHVMGWSTSVVSPPDGDMGDYITALERIRRLDFDIIRPTHGEAITDPDAFLHAYIAHRHHREAQIADAIARGITAIPDMVLDIYDGLDPRLRPAAAHSVLSHLIHMREGGRVSANGPDGIRTAYALA